MQLLSIFLDHHKTHVFLLNLLTYHGIYYALFHLQIDTISFSHFVAYEIINQILKLFYFLVFDSHIYIGNRYIFDIKQELYQWKKSVPTLWLLAHAHTDQVQCIASGLHKKADNKTEVKFWVWFDNKCLYFCIIYIKNNLRDDMLVHSIMLSSDSLVQLSYIIKYYMILSFDHIESYESCWGKLRIE